MLDKLISKLDTTEVSLDTKEENADVRQYLITDVVEEYKPTLHELKVDKITSLSMAYTKANNKNIKFKYKVFEPNTEILSQILSVGSVPDNFAWKTVDNTFVPITYEDIQLIGKLLLKRGQENFIKLQTLKAKVKAARSKNGVAKIEW